MTSKLANQHAPKALFTCVVYTTNNYYLFTCCYNYYSLMSSCLLDIDVTASSQKNRKPQHKDLANIKLFVKYETINLLHLTSLVDNSRHDILNYQCNLK